MLDYSARHYQAKCAKDREAVEEIYKEVQKASKNAIYRNIGDIFFTARTDTEINGAVECNGGVYSTADFSGSQNIGNLLANGSLPYVSLSEYESIVSANGSCRAFAWDGGTDFRVPTIPALLLTKEQSAVVGNGMTLGLTDGTENFGFVSLGQQWSASYQKSQYGSNVGTSINTGEAFISNKTVGITTDPTKSGIVANLDVIEYRAMVQLANGATDQAVITATSVLQQVANKVDKTSATDRETVVGWGMPDYSAGIAVTAEQMLNGFIAPANGLLLCSYGSAGTVHVNNNSFTTQMTYENRQLKSIPLSKGDVFRDASFQANYEGNNIFFPCKGVN